MESNGSTFAALGVFESDALDDLARWLDLREPLAAAPVWRNPPAIPPSARSGTAAAAIR